MRRIVIAVVLGIAAAVSCFGAHLFRRDTAEINSINERIKYAELGADPNGYYSGYTVEELGEGYPKPAHALGKTEIEDFPVVCQFPELPTGCEITCAAALLQFLGFDADKNELADLYMRRSENFYTDDDGTLFGPDPEVCFAGDPEGDGYGCYEKVITNAINSYLQANKADDRFIAVTLPGLNTADLEKLLDEGVPVIVWASGEMGVYRYSEQSVWKIAGTDREVTWRGNSHTLVAVGYDPNAYYFMDCGEAAAIVPYSKEAFAERFKENGSRACTVKLIVSDSEN